MVGAYCLTTKPEHHELLAAFVAERKEATKLSRACIETLSLVAMRQPIPAKEIKEVRCYESSGPLQTLLKRGLITRAYGQAATGKVYRYHPTHYRTTRQFLIRFGLNSPDDFREVEPFKSYFDEIHRSVAYDAWLRSKETQSPEASDAARVQLPPLRKGVKNLSKLKISRTIRAKSDIIRTNRAKFAALAARKHAGKLLIPGKRCRINQAN